MWGEKLFYWLLESPASFDYPYAGISNESKTKRQDVIFLAPKKGCADKGLLGMWAQSLYLETSPTFLCPFLTG